MKKFSSLFPYPYSLTSKSVALVVVRGFTRVLMIDTPKAISMSNDRITPPCSVLTSRAATHEMKNEGVKSVKSRTKLGPKTGMMACRPARRPESECHQRRVNPITSVSVIEVLKDNLHGVKSTENREERGPSAAPGALSIGLGSLCVNWNGNDRRSRRVDRSTNYHCADGDGFSRQDDEEEGNN